MTEAEKIGQLTQWSGGQLTGPDKGNLGEARKTEMIRAGMVGSIINVSGAATINALQRIAVKESRLGIPLLVGLDVIHGYRTVYPIPLAETCSFDVQLAERTAEAAAREMSAAGVRWTFAPMADVARDARWSRVAEGIGEDPFLGAAFTAARVRGFQGSFGADRVAATVKHFAGYGYAEAGRDYAAAELSERALRNIVLPPFRAAVEAGVASVMTSFNEVSGVPSTMNRHLLTDVLRGEWGFNGFVVSDWGSIEELQVHGVAANKTEAAALSFKAGVDVDMCTGTYQGELAGLVKRGAVGRAALDRGVRRVLLVKERLGLFDSPFADEAAEASRMLTEENLELALRAAHESIVLLKNDGTLPLSRPKRVALIGPFGDAGLEPLGCWWAAGKAEDTVTLAAALRKHLPPDARLEVALGTDFRGKKKNIAEAVAVARRADVVLLYVGDPGWNSGENNSKTSLDLSPPQLELVRALADMHERTVLILMNGQPLTLPPEAQDMAAIVETWALGTRSGDAIADVLMGKFNPQGKLAVTLPRSVGQVPIYYAHGNSGRPPTAPGGSHYTDSPASPLYAFGHGLSYTTFSYSEPTLSAPTITSNGSIEVMATVTNTGSRPGVEVAQLYVQDVVASSVRPVKELKGWKRVQLSPGQSQKVTFRLSPAELGFWNVSGRFVVEPGTFKVWVAGDSTGGKEANFEVEAPSKAHPGARAMLR